jgi:hypothetical protein
VGPSAGKELGLGTGGNDAAVADDDDVVRNHLDLVEEVGGQQHGGSPVGVTAEQVAHPPDASGVQPIGRLVEDEDLRVAEEGVRDAEPLPHPEGVVADAPSGLGRGEADELEHLFDPAPRETHHLLGEAQDLPAGAAGVLG